MDYSGDVDRIMYIFSEESSKNEETVLFWRRGIEAFCSDEKSLLFSPLELSVKFIYRDMIPTSIDNSLTILRSRKEIAERDYLINRTMFESIANSAVGWVGSLFTTQEANDKISNSREMILVSLLKATMEALLQSILTECETNHDQLLVVYTCQHCDVNNLDLSFPQLVKKAGNRLKLSNESGSVTKNSIRNKGKGNGDENTMGLLLSQMKEPSLVILEDYMVAMGYAVKSKDLKVIKIFPFNKDPKKETRSPMRGVPVNESARDGGQVKCVSDVDIARLKLKSSISLLEKRISSLDDQATTHREKAITFKVNHDKPTYIIHFLILYKFLLSSCFISKGKLL